MGLFQFFPHLIIDILTLRVKLVIVYQIQHSGKTRSDFFSLQNWSKKQFGYPIYFPQGYWPPPTGLPLCPGQSKPAPTSAPFWMDGALMGFRFSSPPVAVLTSLVSTDWLLFFFAFFQQTFFLNVGFLFLNQKLIFLLLQLICFGLKNRLCTPY